MVCGCFASAVDTQSTLTGTNEDDGGYKITCGLPGSTVVTGATFKKGTTDVDLDNLGAGRSKADSKSILFTKEGRTTHKGDYKCTATTNDQNVTPTESKVVVVGSSAAKVMTSAIIIPLCMLVISLM